MSSNSSPAIAAVIAAAGFSRRMGRFKQLLPWGDSTVIRAVVENLHAAGAAPILCVTGHRADDVAAALFDSPAHIVSNPDYASGEMIGSYRAGIAALHDSQFSGTLLALADQPHIPVSAIRQVIDQARATPDRIVIPSHATRRGHPIYLPRRLWDDLLALPRESSLRHLLDRRSAAILYVKAPSDAIRRDMDAWEDYVALREECETG